uniref:Ribosomal protein L5 n=1 Tax=Psammoneis japonica TaxID=517775 RepID=A0A2U9GIS3_9STRA|nr:ribosomal protein L5 [Psammoneis japonica]AWQ64258.1 ribosomal protein L5 [Psammoneis japonica]
MHFFESYYENIIKYDLINKFHYQNIKELPKLKKIVLNFGCKNSDLKNIASVLLALELIATQRGRITTSKNVNILLKIRKGNPVGCKLVLKKTLMYSFFSKLICQVFLKFKNFSGFNIKYESLNSKAISCKLENSLIFSELEQNYYLFNQLPILNITLVTNTINPKEFLFLLNAFKLPSK